MNFTHLLLVVLLHISFEETSSAHRLIECHHRATRTGPGKQNRFDKENCGKSTVFGPDSHFACPEQTPTVNSTLESPQNGDPVETKGVFPSYVHVNCKFKHPTDPSQNYNSQCSGVLVNHDLVMTLTNCVADKTTCNIQYGHGDYKRGAQFVAAAHVYGYCRFPDSIKPKEVGNVLDVSVLQLHETINFDARQQPACFDFERKPLDQAKCFIASIEPHPWMADAFVRVYHEFTKGCKGLAVNSPLLVDKTCYQFVGRNICDINVHATGSPLYCWENCKLGFSRQFVVGLLSYRDDKRNPSCSDEIQDWVFFMDFKKINDQTKGMLNAMLRNCHEVIAD